MDEIVHKKSEENIEEGSVDQSVGQTEDASTSEPKKGYFTRFKEKWHIKNNLSLFLILLAFSINGSFAVWVAKPVLAFFDVDKATMHPFWYYTARIGLILPIYQITLPIVGAALGQFKFFWAFQKKTVGRMFGKRSSKGKEK